MGGGGLHGQESGQSSVFLMVTGRPLGPSMETHTGPSLLLLGIGEHSRKKHPEFVLGKYTPGHNPTRCSSHTLHLWGVFMSWLERGL